MSARYAIRFQNDTRRECSAAGNHANTSAFRIEKPSHASPDHLLVVAVTKGHLVAAGSAVALVELLLLEVEDVKSLSTMFVS